MAKSQQTFNKSEKEKKWGAGERAMRKKLLAKIEYLLNNKNKESSKYKFRYKGKIDLDFSSSSFFMTNF